MIEDEIASRRSWGIALFVVAGLTLVGVFFAELAVPPGSSSSAT